jgi:cbb3-type cytochrome oxidase subunit 3
MTPEQIEVLFMSPVTQVVAVIVVLSAAWYYLSHARKAVMDPSARKPLPLIKHFLIGSPIKLFLILFTLVLIAFVVNAVAVGGIGI